MGISFITFTRNSEGEIRDMLEHVRGIVDEMIVIDGQSKDNTVAYAQQCGARVYERRPWGYPEPDRMFAVRQATHEWVLFLDLDERLSPLLKDNLRRIVDSQKEETAALRTLRMAYSPKGRPVYGFFVNRQHRIFRRDRATFKGLIHESPKIDGHIIDLPRRFFIAHYGQAGVWQKKWSSYARLEALEYERGSFLGGREGNRREINVSRTLRELAPLSLMPTAVYLLLLYPREEPYINLTGIMWTLRFALYRTLVWTMIRFRSKEETERAKRFGREGLVRIFSGLLRSSSRSL